MIINYFCDALVDLTIHLQAAENIVNKFQYDHPRSAKETKGLAQFVATHQDLYHAKDEWPTMHASLPYCKEAAMYVKETTCAKTARKGKQLISHFSPIEKSQWAKPQCIIKPLDKAPAGNNVRYSAEQLGFISKLGFDLFCLSLKFINCIAPANVLTRHSWMELSSGRPHPTHLDPTWLSSGNVV